MAQVDFRERQLTLKLVYYGPPLSGKTTNLTWLHSQVRELNRGRLMTLDTRDDRTLFFDLLPIFFESSALSFRVKVYTVPGQPMHDATRRVVLTGADGVAFVADSQRGQADGNQDAFQNMLANLRQVGIDAARVPLVVQYNKRDLDDIVSDDELAELAARSDHPIYQATAISGAGVLRTFFGLLDRTWQVIDRQVGLTRGFGLGRDEFMTAVRDHVGVGADEAA